MSIDINETLTFTVNELIRHLLLLKKRGVITGNEEVVDMGFFGISHIQVGHQEGFIVMCSNEAEDAMNHIELLNK